MIRAKAMEILLLVSLTSNLIVAYAVFRMRDRQPSAPSAIDKITGTDDLGREVTLGPDPKGRPTVLYVYSQSCGWCERTTPTLRELIMQEKGRFRFVAADITAPISPSQPYLERNNLQFEAALHPDLSVWRQLRLGGTPDTFVLERNRKIIETFHGAYLGPTLRSVNKFFGLSLKESDAPDSVDSGPKKGCSQDALAFSAGATICSVNATYVCGQDGAWSELAKGCQKGAYTARNAVGK